MTYWCEQHNKPRAVCGCKTEDKEDLKLGLEALKEPGSVPWEEVKERLGIVTETVVACDETPDPNTLDAEQNPRLAMAALQKRVEELEEENAQLRTQLKKLQCFAGLRSKIEHG